MSNASKKRKQATESATVTKKGEPVNVDRSEYLLLILTKENASCPKLIFAVRGHKSSKLLIKAFDMAAGKQTDSLRLRTRFNVCKDFIEWLQAPLSDKDHEPILTVNRKTDTLNMFSVALNDEDRDAWHSMESMKPPFIVSIVHLYQLIVFPSSIVVE